MVDWGANLVQIQCMASALDVDWNLVKQLYIQGVPPVDLCKRFCIKSATLGAKATRLGWTKAKRAASIVEKAIETPNVELGQLAVMVADDAARGLQGRANAMRERLARDCERSLAKLEALDATDLESMELRERTAKMLTDRTMRVFGMEESTVGKVTMMGLAARVIAMTAEPKKLPETSP